MLEQYGEHSTAQKGLFCSMKMCTATTEAIKQLKFELYPHPPYILDPSPMDYHMFGPLKEALHRQIFGRDKVKDAVHTWLRSQPKTLLANWIRRLVNCYRIYIEKRGDYTEKWYTLHFSQIVVHEVINKFTLLSDSALYYTETMLTYPLLQNMYTVKSTTRMSDKSEIQ
jgi:hypothetical protein